MELCKKFLDFMPCQEEAVLTYRASGMVLTIHSDASYLSEPKSRSRTGGHLFMAGKDEIPINNGAVLNISQIIQAVMSTAAAQRQNSEPCLSMQKQQSQCNKR